MGEREHQACAMPALVMDAACPKSFVREFLGGLFGGACGGVATSPLTSGCSVTFSAAKVREGQWWISLTHQQESHLRDSLTGFIDDIETLLTQRFQIDVRRIH